MFELSKQKKELIKTGGFILIMGGPGSGKTTIALLKAKRIIKEELKNGQSVLFLSFARSTITRVEQQAGIIISSSVRKHLEINTYHGFAWTILKSHGYLLHNSLLRLLSPPEAASRLASFSGKEARNIEKQRLFEEEGLVHFDLFASLCAQLLDRSKSLAKIICDTYPVIILDEFQDTNNEEWNLIRILGKNSLLIALADPEQRIYEFRGADPARIGQFIAEFNPTQFNFGCENNRSNGTDISQFGNDLLSGANKKKSYNDVHCIGYPFKVGHIFLKYAVLESLKRLINTIHDNWSLAILVPTNRLMLEVSDYLGSKQRLKNGRLLPAIKHDVALETAALSLAAILIAGLLEGGATDDEVSNRLIHDLCEHIRGCKGNVPPTKTQLTLSTALRNYLESGKIQGKNRRLIIGECLRIARECRKIYFSGDPIKDWIDVRKILFTTQCKEIKQVAIDSTFLRLLHKGSLLKSDLGILWRNNGNYSGAIGAVKNALLQEHFSTSVKTWTGVLLMTMHKAKGKEFDEVIIYEGYYQGRIVRNDASKKEETQALYNLRVAVTRAMKRVKILSPKNNMCPFLK